MHRGGEKKYMTGAKCRAENALARSIAAQKPGTKNGSEPKWAAFNRTHQRHVAADFDSGKSQIGSYRSATDDMISKSEWALADATTAQDTTTVQICIRLVPLPAFTCRNAVVSQ